MTENEAIEELKYDCNELGKAIPCDTSWGQSINTACGIAVKALEEIQQYRAIETEIKERYHANINIKMLMQYFIETIFKGEKHEEFCILTNEEAKMWDKYQEIGTVEECRGAMEKQRKKEPDIWGDGYDDEGNMIYDMYDCPNCGKSYEIDYDHFQYCPECGQRLNLQNPRNLLM